MKYSPKLIKERIHAVNGVLEYLPLSARHIRATDVRFMKFEKDKYNIKFVIEKNVKTSTLVTKHNADYGFNFPYHYAGIPSGYVWLDGKYINGAYGDSLQWYEWGIKDNVGEIGKFTNAHRQAKDFSIQGNPILILKGQMVWKNDGQRCQRTFIGYDAEGNLLLGIADGRLIVEGNYDIGLSCEEMALYMRDKGAINALNGDGGGSTILADRTGGLNQKINTGANERVNHHAMLIYLEEEKEFYKDSDVITYGDLKHLGLI